MKGKLIFLLLDVAIINCLTIAGHKSHTGYTYKSPQTGQPTRAFDNSLKSTTITAVSLIGTIPALVAGTRSLIGDSINLATNVK